MVRAPVLLIPLFLLFTIAAHCQTTMDPASFAGKQIKLLIGYSPTGYGYDTYGRLLAAISANIFLAIPSSSRRIGRARARSISRTISITQPPRTAARSQSSGVASPWNR
jgi:hypothetical protein